MYHCILSNGYPWISACSPCVKCNLHVVNQSHNMWHSLHCIEMLQQHSPCPFVRQFKWGGKWVRVVRNGRTSIMSKHCLLWWLQSWRRQVYLLPHLFILAFYKWWTNAHGKTENLYNSGKYLQCKQGHGMTIPTRVIMCHFPFYASISINTGPCRRLQEEFRVHQERSRREAVNYI